MSVPYLVGIMLFVFDLFGPIKALYTLMGPNRSKTKSMMPTR